MGGSSINNYQWATTVEPCRQAPAPARRTFNAINSYYCTVYLVPRPASCRNTTSSKPSAKGAGGSGRAFHPPSSLAAKQEDSSERAQIAGFDLGARAVRRYPFMHNWALGSRATGRKEPELTSGTLARLAQLPRVRGVCRWLHEAGRSGQVGRERQRDA